MDLLASREPLPFSAVLETEPGFVCTLYVPYRSATSPAQDRELAHTLHIQPQPQAPGSATPYGWAR